MNIRTNLKQGACTSLTSDLLTMKLLHVDASLIYMMSIFLLKFITYYVALTNDLLTQKSIGIFLSYSVIPSANWYITLYMVFTKLFWTHICRCASKCFCKVQSQYDIYIPCNLCTIKIQPKKSMQFFCKLKKI